MRTAKPNSNDTRVGIPGINNSSFWVAFRERKPEWRKIKKRTIDGGGVEEVETCAWPAEDANRYPATSPVSTANKNYK